MAGPQVHWSAMRTPEELQQVEAATQMLNMAHRVIEFRPAFHSNTDRIDDIHFWFNNIAFIQYISPYIHTSRRTGRRKIRYIICFWDAEKPTEILAEYDRYPQFRSEVTIDDTLIGTIKWADNPKSPIGDDLVATRLIYERGISASWSATRGGQYMDMSPGSDLRMLIIATYNQALQTRTDTYPLHDLVFAQEAGVWQARFYDIHMSCAVLARLLSYRHVDFFTFRQFPPHDSVIIITRGPSRRAASQEQGIRHGRSFYGNMYGNPPVVSPIPRPQSVRLPSQTRPPPPPPPTHCDIPHPIGGPRRLVIARPRAPTEEDRRAGAFWASVSAPEPTSTPQESIPNSGANRLSRSNSAESGSEIAAYMTPNSTGQFWWTVMPFAYSTYGYNPAMMPEISAWMQHPHSHGTGQTQQPPPYSQTPPALPPPPPYSQPPPSPPTPGHNRGARQTGWFQLEDP